MSTTRGIVEIDGKQYLLVPLTPQTSIEIADTATAIEDAVSMYENHDCSEEMEPDAIARLNEQREEVSMWLDARIDETITSDMVDHFDAEFPEIEVG